MFLNLQHDFMDRHRQFLQCVAQDPAFRHHPPACAESATTRSDLLPTLRNTDEAQAIARAFISTFSVGNNQANLHLRGHEEEAAGFLTLCLLMLQLYFGGGDYNIATLHNLFGYELERSDASTIDHICASIGTGYQGLRMLLRDDALVAPTFNKGLATPTNLRRIPDGAKPYEHLRADGQRGFTPEEDETLEAYRRYRICKRTSGLAAAQACRALTAPWKPLFQGWQREADALAQAPGSASDAANLLERLERTGAPQPQSAMDAPKHVDLFERIMLYGLSEAACNVDASHSDRMYYESLIATYLRADATA